MNLSMPLISACFRRSSTVGLAPGEVFVLPRLPVALDRFGELDQPLGGVGAAVEQHVLDPLEQLRRDLFVDRQLARR